MKRRAEVLRLFSGLITLSLISLFAGCSGKKNADEITVERHIPETVVGKKVALMEIEGESFQRSSIEVALVNQLKKNGTFILLNKRDIEEVRSRAEFKADDWKKIAKSAGADFALRVRVLKFETEIREGYSKDKIEDPLLAKETGKDEQERLYKVKSIEGEVRFEIQWHDLNTDKAEYGVTESRKVVSNDNRNGAIRLPARLIYLEMLSNEAFAKYFNP